MGLPDGWEVEEDAASQTALPQGWEVEDETTATRSDAATSQNAAPPQDEYQARIRKLIEDSNKTFGMNNEALLAGMVRVPALGFRRQAGQFGAAVMDKAMGSELPFGELYDRAKPQVEKYYGDLESEHPIASGVGTMVGGAPLAMAFTPAATGAGMLTEAAAVGPSAARALQIGAAGVDNAALAGLLRFNETGSTDAALDDASVAGAMGAGFAAAPYVYRGAKQLTGAALKAPRQGLDKLYRMLGGSADDAASAAAPAVSDAVQSSTTAAPTNVSPLKQDDIETKLTPIRNFLRDADGSMYLGGKKPRFKSKKEAFQKIAEASGVDDFGKQSVEAGHFDEIEGLVGRKVKNTEDAFNALVAASAKKRGKKNGTRDWEDVQTAIRELKKLDGLEDLQLPSDVQDAILPIEEEPSFNFGFNEKPAPAPAKNPDFLRKSQELANMLDESADTVITPAPVHGDPNIKHKGKYRGQQAVFPQDKAGWENEPHWWKAGADDSEPSGGIMDLMMQESESPQAAAAMEALNKGERNMSRWRNPADVDSRVGRVPVPFPEPVPASSFEAVTKPRATAKADMPTNAKGGGDLYDPMGLGDAPNVRPSDAELFADVRRKAAAAGKPDFSTAREATAGEEALWGEALNRLRAKGLIENVETAGGQATRVVTDSGQPFPDPLTMTKPAPAPFPDPVTMTQIPQPGGASATPMAPPADDAAQIASGKDRIRELLGKVGKYTGAAAGFKSGGVMGAIGGAQVGAKSAPRTFDMMDKGADKLHAMGQKLLTDPAKLMQLEQQGGQMGKAASFIMDGAREGGEAAMAARAYIISSQPWWRAQFANQDQD